LLLESNSVPLRTFLKRVLICEDLRRLVTSDSLARLCMQVYAYLWPLGVPG
jgi:hypothetical protein